MRKFVVIFMIENLTAEYPRATRSLSVRELFEYRASSINKQKYRAKVQVFPGFLYPVQT